MENNKQLKTNWNGQDNLPAIGANPPRTRPPKAKTQIASALFHPRDFLLSRSFTVQIIFEACGLCFVFFLVFNIAYAFCK